MTYVVASLATIIAGTICACQARARQSKIALEWIAGALILLGLALIGAGLAPIVHVY